MKDWIVPEDFDLVMAEAHHLITSVDVDMDEKLTRVIKTCKSDQYIQTKFSKIHADLYVTYSVEIEIRNNYFDFIRHPFMRKKGIRFSNFL